MAKQDNYKMFGIGGEPIKNVVAVYSKPLPSFDDKTKVATAYRALVDNGGSYQLVWFNTYRPLDGSEPAFIGTRVNLAKATSSIKDVDAFVAKATEKGYAEVPVKDWPPTVVATADVAESTKDEETLVDPIGELVGD